MKFIGIIPARYASSRFPGKPLAVLGGKYVIQRVYETVSSVLDEAYVATDDQRIFDAVIAFGGKAVMTRTDHKSGTDRIEEAAEKLATDADVIVNIQGDEPFIQPSQIQTICHCFDDASTQIATIGKPFDTIEAAENPQLTEDSARQQWLRHVFLALCHPLRKRHRKERVAAALSLPQASRHLCLSPRSA